MSDLRAELVGAGGVAIPRYRMLLPPGWQGYDVDMETERELVAAARERLAGAGRPDLAGRLGAQVGDALRSLRSQNAFAYAFAGESSPTWALGAASLVGIKRVASPEVPLDAIVEDAIRNRGAAALGEDHRIVRWTESSPVVLDGVRAVSFLVHYLIAIPGSRRTQAVQWTATVAHAEDLAEDDPVLQAWTALFDHHIATFTWSVR
ncbi:hypothetical protein SAMN05216488_1841 [Microbacterium sp. LKL04]|uniref:Uncharacterized protein n=1 Tax=Microbacterium oleivorans TaxID=273677 RepID=A0A4R5YFU7_9MICO|nr:MULTISPECIES: hypothetical protein [Microbacterium]TDL42215.1 hypothetical protein E2R54_14665 [Microbacterium oleivorans]SCY44609.1 hypothetical protein SAMN05216488_1841 [Microbacterium sp. LKL04]